MGRSGEQLGGLVPWEGAGQSCSLRPPLQLAQPGFGVSAAGEAEAVGKDCSGAGAGWGGGEAGEEQGLETAPSCGKGHRGPGSKPLSRGLPKASVPRTLGKLRRETWALHLHSAEAPAPGAQMGFP